MTGRTRKNSEIYPATCFESSPNGWAMLEEDIPYTRRRYLMTH